MGDTRFLARKIEALLFGGGPRDEIETLLTANSNLPGPRGNLELAAAFADCVERTGTTDTTWNLLLGWTSVGEEDAPTGDPREFLPFCALQALGALFPAADPDRRSRIVEALRLAANDGRWRTREGVAMAFQRIGERDFDALRAIFSGWLGSASLLERRAIVAALAHPPILRSPDRTGYCLEVSDRILADILVLGREARRAEEFRVLRQGLEYAISVFVAPFPVEGFDFLRKWAQLDDADVRRIVKSNASKNRLVGRYPEQAAEVVALLAAAPSD